VAGSPEHLAAVIRGELKGLDAGLPVRQGSDARPGSRRLDRPLTVRHGPAERLRYPGSGARGGRDLSASDWLTYAAVVVVILAVSFAACYLPARRASKEGRPIEALQGG